MCAHLRDIYWIGRDFNSANAPLHWAFTVLTTLVDDRQYDLAEDVAMRFFEAEEHCDRHEQLKRTRQWMRHLTDPAGEVMPEPSETPMRRTSTTAKLEVSNSPAPHWMTRSANNNS
jgi:hypothetical protein